MNIPDGIWKPCYKYMTIFEGNWYSYNVTTKDYGELIYQGKNIFNVLRYEVGKITIPKIGKLFGVSQPDSIWVDEQTFLTKGIGLNINPGPEKVIDFIMKLDDLVNYWQHNHKGVLLKENPINHSILMDAYIPFERI